MCSLTRNCFFHAVAQVGSRNRFRELFKFSRTQGQGDSSKVDVEMSVLAFLNRKMGICASGCLFPLHFVG